MARVHAIWHQRIRKRKLTVQPDSRLECASTPGHVLSYAWGDVRGHRGGSFSKIDPPFYVHGPEVGFARRLYSRGARKIAIIKVANNIPAPPKGPEWPWTNKDLSSASPAYYAQWSDFVRARLADIKSEGSSYSLGGFVWDEGIDDAFNRATEAEYRANLTRLIGQIRADFGTPTTPVCIVRSQIAACGSHGDGSYPQGPGRSGGIRSARILDFDGRFE